MNTLDEILEGVTAGGQWRADGAYLRESGHTYLVGEFYVKASRQAEKDASYAVWAARNAPALVRALDLMITACPLCHGEGMVMPSRDPAYKLPCEHCAKGRAVLAEALKD